MAHAFGWVESLQRLLANAEREGEGWHFGEGGPRLAKPMHRGLGQRGTLSCRPQGPRRSLVGLGLTLVALLAANRDAFAQSVPATEAASGEAGAAVVAHGTASRRVLSAGHADVVLRYNPPPQNDFTVAIALDEATVDGASGITAHFDVSEVVVATAATFEHPSPIPLIDVAYDALGVPAGERVFWLPQNNSDAAAQAAPFLGWRNESEPGQLIGDTVTVRLLDVRAPGDTDGAFSFWSFGSFLPEFFMSSADGIDSEDAVTLLIGHEHYNLGFAPTAAAGDWVLDLRAVAMSSAGPVEQDFQLHVRTLGPAAVPLLPSGALVGLGAGLMGVGLGRWRRHGPAPRRPSPARVA